MTLALTVDQADQIRMAWYVMDGPSDRPRTVTDCHAMIEHLLQLLGEVTGITDAGAVSALESDEIAPCSDCGRIIRYIAEPWYAVDSGGVCEPCAVKRYGDRAPEYLIS